MVKHVPDEKDLALIALLRANGREPAAALARKVGLSRSAVQERVARLERQGIIAGYTVRLNEDPFLGGLQTHVMLTVDPKRANDVVSALKDMPEILSCLAVSGAYDLIAVAAAPSTEDMDSLLDEIGALPGVARTTSSVVLSTKFDRH